MGAVIHNVMVLLSCGLVCYSSSFLPVLSVSPTIPTQHLLSLLDYHFLIIILAVAVIGVEQFGIILWLAPSSRLGCFGAVERPFRVMSATGS